MEAADTFCHYTHQLCPDFPRASARSLFKKLSRSPEVAFIGENMPLDSSVTPASLWQWVTGNMTHRQVHALQAVFPGQMRANWGVLGVLLLFIAIVLIVAFALHALVFTIIEKFRGHKKVEEGDERG